MDIVSAFRKVSTKPGQAQFDLLLDAPSNRLFIVDPFSPRLLIVDVSEPGGQVVEMPLPLDPRGYLFSGRLPLAIEPTSGALYVGDPAKRRIYRMDPDQPLAAAITIDLPEGTCAANTLVVNAIEKTLFVPGCTGSIEVVDIDQTRATYHTVVGRLLLPSDVALPLWEWEYGRLAVDAASGRLFVAAEALTSGRPPVVIAYDGRISSDAFGQQLGATVVPYTDQPPATLQWSPETGRLYLLVTSGLTMDNSQNFLVVLDARNVDGAMGIASIQRMPTGPGYQYNPILVLNPATRRLYAGVDYRSVIVYQEPLSQTAGTAPAVGPLTVSGLSATMTFAAVDVAGTTTVEQVITTDAMLPPHFEVAGQSFEITTTASVLGPITICFNVGSVTDPTLFRSLRVLHGEDGVLVDRTSSWDYATGTICATTDSLSPFVIARKRPVTYAVETRYDTSRAVKSGSTVPVRIRLLSPAGENASASDVVVTAMRIRISGDATETGVEDSGQANPDSNFRFDPDLVGYVFNLSTHGLAPGVCLLDFVVSDDPQMKSVEFRVGR